MVVWKRDLYIQEANRQLSDNRFYQRLDADPIQQDQKIVKNTIKDMIASCELPPTAKHLVVTTPRTSRFYMLPKIHKPNNPGRPIVSACCCPTENISAYLDEVMAPFVKQLPTYVKDTNHALSIFDSFTFDASDQRPCFLFTMDVKSLYTVIPNDGGLQALSYFLDQRTIKEPSTHTLVRLAELVLTLNAFSFDHEHYRQIGGVAMGSKMGPNYACLFVGYIEERIRSAYTGFVPQLHKRYIDDVVGAAQCSRLELDDFINYVSNFHPALQFTSNISDLELPFLDIKLKINNHNIQTSVHYKATDTHNYLHHTSLHPDHCKQAIPYSQFLRLRRICSDNDDFAARATEMKAFFHARGYPEALLNGDLCKISTVSRNEALRPPAERDSTESRVPLVLTFNQFNTGTKRILFDNFQMLLSDPATRTIYPELPLVSYRRDRNLRDYLVHSAERTDSDAGTFACRHPRCLTCQHTTSQTILQSPKRLYTIRDHFTCLSVNVVYSIICRRCGCLYIGETGRRLRERFGEHLRSIRNNSPGFPVAEHFNSASHSLNDIMICGLKRCSGDNTRRKKQEMRLIFELGTLKPNGLNINFSFI